MNSTISLSLSKNIFLFGLFAVLSICIAFQPLNMSAIILIIIFSLIAFFKPSLLVLIFISTGAISFSFITKGQKNLFASMGGIDFNGLRLISITAGLLLFGSLRGYFKKLPLKIYVFFLLFAFLSLFHSANPLAGLRTLMKLLLPYLLFLAIRFESQNPQFPVSIKKAFDIAAILMLTISGIMFLMGIASDFAPGIEFEMTHVDHKRFMGSTGNWAATAAFSTFFSLLFYSRFLVEKKNIYLFLFGIFFLLLILTLSRTEIAAFTVGFFLINLILRKRIVAILSLVIVLLISVLYTPIRNRAFNAPRSISEVFTLEALSDIHNTGRLETWTIIIPFILKNPITGNGLGSIERLLVEGEDENYVPHNEYLRLSADLGLAAPIIFLLSYIALGRLCWKKFKTGDLVQKHQAALAISSIVAYLMICISDNGIDWYSTATQYVWAFAAIALFTTPPKNTLQEA